MKTIPFLIIGLLLFLTVKGDDIKSQPGTQNPPASGNTLTIGCVPELNSVTTNWVSGYSQIDQSANIAVSNTDNDQGINLRLVSDEYIQTVDKSAWRIVIGHEAIVPVMNSKNPMLEDFFREGVSAEKWKEVVTASMDNNWGTIFQNNKNVPVHYYFLDQQIIKSALTEFTKADEGSFKGTGVADINELMSALQSDVYGIAFCRLSDAIMSNSNNLVDNISIVPIDKNSNGRLDQFENIYSNVSDFTRGAWVGKYPKSLCNNIYAVAAQKPSDKTQLAFLNYILSDGQKWLNGNGYIILASNESRASVENLNGAALVVLQPEEQKSNIVLILIIAGVLVAGVLTTIVIRSVRSGKAEESIQTVSITEALNENSIEAPAGLYYDKSHTWAFMEKDGKVRVGIDDFLPHLTGKFSRVIMKEPGEAIRKGEKIITISRDGKQISLYAPVSGTITDQNSALINNPGIINTSPYNYGWVYMIEPKNWLRETQFMFMRDKYKEWLKDEFFRLRDFLTASVKTNNSAFAHIVLQDGGELTNNVLADLEPEVWEDFQTKFIDTSK